MMGSSQMRLLLTSLVGFMGGGPRAYLGGRQVNRYMMWSLEELGSGGESKEPVLGDCPRWALRTRRLISFLLGGTVFIPFCRH